jgi:hypothetical protein
MEVNMSEDKISVGEAVVATVVATGLIAGALKTAKFVKNSGGLKPAKDKVMMKIVAAAKIGKGLLSDKETRQATLKAWKARIDADIAESEVAADNKDKEEKSVPEEPVEAEFSVVPGNVESAAIDGKDVLETGVKQFVGYIPKDGVEMLTSKYGIQTGYMGKAEVTGNTNLGVGLLGFDEEVRVAGTVAIEGIQAELEPLVGVTGLKYVLEEEPDNKEDKNAIKVYLTV